MVTDGINTCRYMYTMYLSINRNRQITANILSQEVVYFMYFSINFSAFIIIVLFILIIYIFVLDRKLHDTGTIFSIPVLFFQLVHIQTVSLYPPQQSCRGVYWFHHVRPSVCRQILCHTIT